MKIVIADDDLFTIRQMLDEKASQIETSPNPSAGGGHDLAARRVIKRINWALKKIHGHDCHGNFYMGRKGFCGD